MPFRIRPTPTVNVNAGRKITAQSHAAIIEAAHNVDDWDDLPELAREMGAPDHEVGAGSPKEGGGTHEGKADHIQTPIYPDAIPWEPERAVDHKPFKLKEP